MSQKIQFRRGTEVNRLSTVFDQGEPTWDVTKKTLYIGDGVTVGGIPMSGQNAGLNLDTIVYRTGTQSISGVKTFANAVGFSHAVVFAGNSGVFIDGNRVHNQAVMYRTGDQVISGNKTFVNPTTMNSSLLLDVIHGLDDFLRINIGNSRLINAGETMVDWSTSELKISDTETSVNWSERTLSGNWQIATASPPTGNFQSNGTKGYIALSGGFLYACTGTNLWGRTALSTF